MWWRSPTRARTTLGGLYAILENFRVGEFWHAPRTRDSRVRGAFGGGGGARDSDSNAYGGRCAFIRRCVSSGAVAGLSPATQRRLSPAYAG